MKSRTPTAPTPEAASYALKILARCRVAHLRLRPGQVLRIQAGHLRSAAWLVKVGSARPLDERTATEIELFQRLQDVLPHA